MSQHELKTENAVIRHDWSQSAVLDLFALPFNDLLFRAHQLYRLYFNPCKVQISTLLSIKTGACPEDCKYCPQCIRYDTGHVPFPGHQQACADAITRFIYNEQAA